MNIKSLLGSLPGISALIVCVMLKSMPALEDGDGFCEVHVNTLGRFLSLRSCPRPHPEFLKQNHQVVSWFFEFVHNARKRGKAMLSALLECLLT